MGLSAESDKAERIGQEVPVGTKSTDSVAESATTEESAAFEQGTDYKEEVEEASTASTDESRKEESTEL